MGKADPLKSGLRMVKEQAVDPLAQLIATRMAGQLESIPQVLPELGGLNQLNIPAAYAGDQRSLVPIQRAISKAETGLESPGRRKILKQGAATALRSAVPDSVAKTLGTTALKKAVVDAVTIPDESIQAAYAAAFKAALRSPNFESISPEAVAKASGLPIDSISQYLMKKKLDPKVILQDWLDESEMQDAFFDSTEKHQFYDYMHELTPEELKAHSAKLDRPDLRKALEDGETDGLYDAFYDLLYQKNMDKATAQYQDLLGKQHYDEIRRMPDVPDPTSLADERFDILNSGEHLPNHVDEGVGQLLNMLGYQP